MTAHTNQLAGIGKLTTCVSVLEEAVTFLFHRLLQSPDPASVDLLVRGMSFNRKLMKLRHIANHLSTRHKLTGSAVDRVESALSTAERLLEQRNRYAHASIRWASDDPAPVLFDVKREELILQFESNYLQSLASEALATANELIHACDEEIGRAHV